MPVTTLVTRPTRTLAVSAYLSMMMLMSCVVALAQGGAASGKPDASHYGADSTKTASATVKVVAAAPKVGQPAPDFKLPYATQEALYMKPEEQMTLASQRGKNVILAFYPADWSGGCTKEVCTLRDTFAELSKLNATVLGISGDYVFSHQEWAKFHKLQFPLLSDHDHAVAKTYDSYMADYGFNKRTVYLIDKEGVVRYVNLAFKAGDKKDYDALRAELEKLK
ncbi:MAG TPA: peroxiredoxin [Pyrinomonadaceae bacterium]|nr:peroxiredoxin [Pyrinomonadaceae bacterium]